MYAVDAISPIKRTRARELILVALETERLVISTQVMNEFVAVCLRKRLLEPAGVEAILQSYLDGGVRVVSTQATSVMDAISLMRAYQLGWWDSLIVGAALSASCTTLYSEDMHAGLCFGKLEIVDPFSHAAHERVTARRLT